MAEFHSPSSLGEVKWTRSVVSDSLWPHGLQHARLPCPSSSPATFSSSCPLSQWCHPIISIYVIPLPSCLQSFPASGKVCCCYSVAKLFDSLQPRGLQHAGSSVLHYLPVCSNSCPFSQWCYRTISSSAAPFFWLQSFPALGFFPMNWLFTSGGQSFEASASASVLPMNIQGWFPLGLTGLIPCCPRDSQESSPAPQFESISS